MIGPPLLSLNPGLLSPIAPSEPTNLQVYASNSETLVVEWEPPVDDGGGPIVGYLLEYRNALGNFVLIMLSSDGMPMVEMEYKLSGLQDNTTYK